MKYKTIVIDPPWTIAAPSPRTVGFHRRRSDSIIVTQKINYNLMSDEQIKKFPIDNYADDNCDLFLWTIQSRLPICFDILKQWKFNYKRLIIWHKKYGYNNHLPISPPAVNGWEYNAEFILHATRGKSHFQKTAPLFHTVQSYKIRGHSIKPAEIYQKLREKTAEPRIDIFARRRHEGYDAWGDQVEDTMQTTMQEVLR